MIKVSANNVWTKRCNQTNIKQPWSCKMLKVHPLRLSQLKLLGQRVRCCSFKKGSFSTFISALIVLPWINIESLDGPGLSVYTTDWRPRRPGLP